MKKRKKTTCVFVIFQKHGKFWSISFGNFIKHKPVISEECLSSWFDCVSPCIRNLCTPCQKLANKIEAPKFGYNKPFLDHLSIKKIGQCNNNKNKDFHNALKFEKYMQFIKATLCLHSSKMRGLCLMALNFS